MEAPHEPVEDVKVSRKGRKLITRMNTMGFRPHNEFHRRMHALITSNALTAFRISIFTLVTIEFFVMYSFPNVTYVFRWHAELFVSMVLAIFVAEIVLKIYVFRLQYFRVGWTIFEFILISIGLLDFFIGTWLWSEDSKDQIPGRFLALRIIQVFIVMSKVLDAQLIIRFMDQTGTLLITIWQSLKDLGSVIIIMAFIMYMFAVLGVGLFGHIHDDMNRFNGVGWSFWTMFELVTLDDWFFIVTDFGHIAERHYAFLFCFVFIVLLNYIFLSLFVAVIVDNFERMRKKRAEEKITNQRAEEIENIADSGENVSEMEAGEVSVEKTIGEYYTNVKSESALTTLENHFLLMTSIDYQKHELDQLNHLLDELVDMTVTISH